MDPASFDALTRAFHTAGSRRLLLRRLVVSLPLGGVLAVTGEARAAERPLDRVQGRTPRRNRQQRNTRRSNNKNNNNNQNTKDQNNGPGHPRTQDCPDSKIQCYTVDSDGCRQLFVGEFPSVGQCWSIESGCCPCDHPDYAYWENLCNQTFPDGCAACRDCTGKCMAIDNVDFACAGFTSC